jgi:GTP cyclohydrolase I
MLPKRYCRLCNEEVDLLSTFSGECKIAEDGLHVLMEYGFEDAKGAVRMLLNYLGIDSSTHEVADTPGRLVLAYREMTQGYNFSPEMVLGRIFEEPNADQMVIVRSIPFVSLCEHHLLPFSGTVDVGYLPSANETTNKYRIAGLSKLARLVDCYAMRLQLQERLTQQIASALMNKPLYATGAAVVVRATHSCISCRGVRKHGCETITSVMLGCFRDEPEARAEFMALCRS